jgi:hypothetical protein
MDVLLKEAGCCTTKITGKDRYRTAASLLSTIPNSEGGRKAGCGVRLKKLHHEEHEGT